MHLVLLSAGVFAACVVEMVEALTIVLAVGTTRGWRSVAAGSAAALCALALLVGILGPAITHLPISVLRVVVGGLLLVFGLQWLRKAILRAGGVLALHDEGAVYEKERAAAQAGSPGTAGGRSGVDWYGFSVAGKGVFLEGLEVVFIVVTFGAAQGRLGVAVLAALAALLVVAAAGLLVHRPLRRVPENALKFGVGVLLSAFGMFWSTEGVGVHWPAGDAFVIVLVAVVLGMSLALSAGLRAQRTSAVESAGRP
jgi:uncharacterized membrane protein